MDRDENTCKRKLALEALDGIEYHLRKYAQYGPSSFNLKEMLDYVADMRSDVLGNTITLEKVDDDSGA